MASCLTIGTQGEQEAHRERDTHTHMHTNTHTIGKLGAQEAQTQTQTQTHTHAHTHNGVVQCWLSADLAIGMSHLFFVCHSNTSWCIGLRLMEEEEDARHLIILKS